MVVTLGAVAEPASAQPLLVTRVGNANNVSESGVFAPAIGLPNGQIRWNVVTNTVENLPGYLGAIQTSPQHISGDGSVLVGIAVDNDGRQSKYRWTAASGFINLIGQGSVTDLSDDAQTTVGFSNSAAVRWLGASQSPVGLGTPQGWTNSFAYGTNADGTVIVGWATTPSGQRAFRWTQATGMQDLGVLPGSSTSEASAVSGDGLVIVGSVSPPRIAFRWTAAGGMQSLGTFSGQINSTAVMVSGDGSVILGTSGSAPFIWTPWLGMTPLLSYLQSVGVNMAGWTGITLKGISSDGGTIVGTGIFGSQFLSFAVTGLDFTPPCPADFDGDGTVNSQDFFDFLAAFFMLQPAADFNHDAFINSQDFFDFLAAFFAGC